LNVERGCSRFDEEKKIPTKNSKIIALKNSKKKFQKKFQKKFPNFIFQFFLAKSVPHLIWSLPANI
jgi:hypothetical protein